jgi:putative membrane protein
MAGQTNPYERFSQQEIILRDQLAMDRTILANERTFLAYIRTSLAFFIVGGWFVKFFDSRLINIVGAGLVVCAFSFFILGAKRFYTIKKRLAIGTTPPP